MGKQFNRYEMRWPKLPFDHLEKVFANDESDCLVLRQQMTESDNHSRKNTPRMLTGNFRNSLTGYQKVGYNFRNSGSISAAILACATRFGFIVRMHLVD